jgi:hypothetical protein
MSEIIIPYEWSPRNYQLNCWSYFEPNIEGLRGCAVWHRRAGKDLLGINLVGMKHLQRVGTYWHLLPTYKQGRAIVWNGFTRTGRRFIDHFHPRLVTEKNKTEMSVSFRNGSRYQVVGTDDIDSLVGTNPVGCIFSEYSLQDPGAWNYLRPILAENGGWALFIFTARGKNHGYRMKEMAMKNRKWFCEVLVAGDNGTKKEDGTPVISDAAIQDERDAGMEEAMIQQEFFCSFEAPLVGAYFGSQMSRLDDQKRITKVPWDPALPVDTAWDLGMDDCTAIWFIQSYGHEVRIIDFYKNSGEGLGHYARVLNGQEEGHEYMGDFLYGKHYAPHDITVREMGTGKSRLEVAKEMGIRFTVVKKHEVADGIEAVRMLLPMCWIDEDKCDHGVQALKSYRKEWNENNKTFNSSPVHDWASHPADALRSFAWGRKRGDRSGGGKMQNKATDRHDYMHPWRNQENY